MYHDILPNFSITPSQACERNFGCDVSRYGFETEVIQNNWSTYCKVLWRSMSWLVAHPRIFRLFMDGKLDAYLL